MVSVIFYFAKYIFQAQKNGFHIIQAKQQKHTVCVRCIKTATSEPHYNSHRDIQYMVSGDGDVLAPKCSQIVAILEGLSGTGFHYQSPFLHSSQVLTISERQSRLLSYFYNMCFLDRCDRASTCERCKRRAGCQQTGGKLAKQSFMSQQSLTVGTALHSFTHNEYSTVVYRQYTTHSSLQCATMHSVV